MMSFNRLRSSTRGFTAVRLWRWMSLAVMLAVATAALAVVAGTGGTQAASSGSSQGGPSIAPQQEQAAPLRVERVIFRNEPDGDVFVTGEEIRLGVEFNHSVDQDSRGETVKLALQVGDVTRSLTAIFEGDWAYFNYEVQDEDYDADGVLVEPNSLTGLIEYVNGTVDAAEVSHAGVPGGANRRVHDAPYPEVESLALVSEPEEDVYEPGEEIQVEVTFNTAIVEDDEDRLKLGLKVGDHERTMRASFDGATVTFSYTVTNRDYDPDGVVVEVDSLSGTISSGERSFDAGDLTHDGLDGGSDHHVQELQVLSMEIYSDPGDDGAYVTGDSITIKAVLNTQIQVVFGAPPGDPKGSFQIQIGGNERISDLDSGGNGQVFYYFTVTDDDIDEDGVSVPANPFEYNYAVFGFNVADLSDFAHPGLSDDPDHLVNPQIDIESITITSTPEADDTYGTGETITINVEFTEDVYVDGESGDALPTIALSLDGATRVATANVDLDDTVASIDFEYTVSGGDSSENGVGVRRNSLDANDTTIKFDSDDSDVDPRHRIVAADSGHLVDATVSITSVSFSSEPEDANFGYLLGDEITVEVTFDGDVELVDDADTPTLAAVDHDASNRTFDRTFTYSDGSGTDTWTFVSTVEKGDVAFNGISIHPINEDNGWADGLVESTSGGDVDVSHDGLAPDDSQQVYGGILPIEIGVTSSPSDGISYASGEVIKFTVAFEDDQQVAVETDPEIDLRIGDNVRTATYVEGAQAYDLLELKFEYTIADDDADSDGIEILDTAWRVGERHHRGYVFATNEYEYRPIPKFVNPSPGVLTDHRVAVAAEDGAISEVSITSEPDDANVGYVVGDTITVEVEFDTDVELVDEEDKPEIRFTDVNGISTSWRAFSYSDGSGTDTWTFTNTVGKGSRAYYGLTLQAIGSDTNWDEDQVQTTSGGSVDTSIETLPSFTDQRIYGGVQVTGVSVTSSPANGTDYLADEKFTFTVTFNESVSVETNPIVRLQIGDNQRTATLASNQTTVQVTTLKFEYTIQGSDEDDDGIEILDTNFRVGDQFPNGYVFSNDSVYSYMPIWRFVNPSAGALSDHKVNTGTAQRTATQLDWTPAQGG